MPSFYLDTNHKGEKELVNYPYRSRDCYQEIENTEFLAKVEILDSYTGRSARGLVVQVTGHPSEPTFTAKLTLKDFVTIVKSQEIIHGTFSCLMKFKKRGANSFIAPVEGVITK